MCVCARASKSTPSSHPRKRKAKRIINCRGRTWQEEDVHVSHHCLHGDFGSVKGKSERESGDIDLKDNDDLFGLHIATHGHTHTHNK